MRVAIVNMKGGAGKTTSAVHLSLALAARGRTLLIDADPQGSLLSWRTAAGDDWPAAQLSTSGLAVPDLHKQLAPLAADYEHVVIDTPPEVEVIVKAAVLAAELVLLPIPPNLIDLDRLKPTLDLLTEVEPIHPGNLQVQILLTRMRRGTNSARDAKQALEQLGMPILKAEIPLLERYASAFGTAVVGTDYEAVLEELLAAEVAA